MFSTQNDNTGTKVKPLVPLPGSCMFTWKNWACLGSFGINLAYSLLRSHPRAWTFAYLQYFSLKSPNSIIISVKPTVNLYVLLFIAFVILQCVLSLLDVQMYCQYILVRYMCPLFHWCRSCLQQTLMATLINVFIHVN